MLLNLGLKYFPGGGVVGDEFTTLRPQFFDITFGGSLLSWNYSIRDHSFLVLLSVGHYFQGFCFQRSLLFGGYYFQKLL